MSITDTEYIKEALSKATQVENRETYSAEFADKHKYVTRTKVKRPQIGVEFSSSSIIAGADKIFETITEYIEDREIDADIYRCGSVMLSTSDVVISVQMPGKCRLFFERVKTFDVNLILDAVLNNFAPETNLLGQYIADDLEPWFDVPALRDHIFFKGQRRALIKDAGFINPESITEYIATGGYAAFLRTISFSRPEDVYRQIMESGLRGRGGGGYPTYKKWKSVIDTDAAVKYLICNADESDPGAFMDRALIENNPHSLLEGIAITAYANNINNVIIYIRNAYTLAVERLQKAINDAYENGIFGFDIFFSGYNINVQVVLGAGAYVCGEETALIQSVTGNRAMPQVRPPYPVTNGYNGAPTLVHNCETLANVKLIIDKGVDWYRGISPEKASTGTKLFSVCGDSLYNGVVEVPFGTVLQDMVNSTLGDIKDEGKLKAVQLGGPAGGILDPDSKKIILDYEDLRYLNGDLGSGGITLLSEDVCLIDLVKYHMSFIKSESCGKCIPCREGSRQIYRVLSDITRKPDKDDKQSTLERFKGIIQLENLAKVMQSTSLCGLGKTAATPVLSTLKWFRKEYEEHIFERSCPSGTCVGLRTYVIDIDMCTGCGACLKRCKYKAIIGSPKLPYYIVEDRCVGCGACFNVCKFSAVKVK